MAFLVVVSITGVAAIGLGLLAYLGLYARRDLPGGFMRRPVDLIPPLAVTAVLLLGISIGLALLAANRVLRPVRRLAAAADEIASGKLDIKLVVPGDDELGDLTRSFNSMASSLAAKIAELQRLEERGKRFAGDVSHELRTPLAAMTAVAEVLSDEADSLSGPAAAAAHLVVRETRHLNRLVEDLIEMSQFDSGGVLMMTAEIDLVPAIHECLRLRGLTGAVTIDAPGSLKAHVDPRRFGVILANLVGNALQHGQPPITVELQPEPRRDGEWIILRVTDHGPGIPAESVSRVFDRFFKANSARSRSQGSGLGLAIAWENAQLHLGTITAANRAEGGATFTLRLPRDGSEHPRERSE